MKRKKKTKKREGVKRRQRFEENSRKRGSDQRGKGREVIGLADFNIHYLICINMRSH